MLLVTNMPPALPTFTNLTLLPLFIALWCVTDMDQ